MPKQKDLKRIVRSRMHKTGESYTTARLQVLKKKQPDYAKIAGMSDAAVIKRTGHTWSEWVQKLDAAHAAELPHREIAEYVSSLGTPDWWSQMVTVGYERIRGLRDKGQRRGGSYETSKSRTFAVPVAKLYNALARWIRDEKIPVRTATRPKTMRLTWRDNTLVQFYFTAKGKEKSQLTVQHQKLAGKADVEKTKAFWEERLGALSKLLA